MSKKRLPLAHLIVVGPSPSEPSIKGDAYYELVYATPIKELELEVAIRLQKNTFTVGTFIDNEILVELEPIRFRSIKRPYTIIKRYSSWDEIITVDKQEMYKARVEEERFLQVQLEDERRWEAHRNRSQNV